MGYNAAKIKWQKEEALMCLTEKKIMKMQEIIFIEKCTAIITTAIAYIFMVLGDVIAGE